MAVSSPDDRTLRPAASDEGLPAPTAGERPDGGARRHNEPAPVNLHLTLLPGDRLWGAVGRVGDQDRRLFRGWLDLMYAIQQLRGQQR